jgi:CubicO group peptidase (beta-lactamase class C family)
MEVYDLRVDPLETKDLVAAGPSTAEAQQHMQELEGYRLPTEIARLYGMARPRRGSGTMSTGAAGQDAACIAERVTIHHLLSHTSGIVRISLGGSRVRVRLSNAECATAKGDRDRDPEPPALWKISLLPRLAPRG